MSTQDPAQLNRIRTMIESAEMALKSAKQLLDEMDGGGAPVSDKRKLPPTLTRFNAEVHGDEQIIEGMFDGQNMLGPNQKAYPVPANYASKSKLIPGDVLKLTITPEGTFLYKQIGPIERKHIKGYLAYDEGQYKVIADGKGYKVLLASITYFKANVGDEVTLIVPLNGDVEWAAIENVIPRL